MSIENEREEDKWQPGGSLVIDLADESIGRAPDCRQKGVVLQELNVCICYAFLCYPVTLYLV